VLKKRWKINNSCFRTANARQALTRSGRGTVKVALEIDFFLIFLKLFDYLDRGGED
jgi:hypothetical protein